METNYYINYNKKNNTKIDGNNFLDYTAFPFTEFKRENKGIVYIKQ
jgi:hypothetical protein